MDDETRRLESLRALQLLDTPPEAAFDRIVRLLAMSLDVPIAFLSLIDEERQWFKARVGLELEETARKDSFCRYTIQEPEALIVEDACADARFVDNPLVLGSPQIRFYAGVPFHAPDGAPVGSLCAVDVAPRRLSPDELRLMQDLRDLAEMELVRRQWRDVVDGFRESEQRWRILSDGNRDAVIIHQDGVIVDVNPQMAKWLGYPDAEVLGRLVAHFVTPASRRAVEAASHAHTRFQYEATFVNAHGEAVPAELLSYPITWRNAPARLAVIRDLTVQRQLQRHLEAARDQAVETARIKAELLANLSHEIRTPLAAVAGMAEILGETLLGDTQRFYVDSISRATTQLLAILNNALDLSKAEHGRMELDLAVDSAVAISESVIDLMAPPALQKGLDLQLAIDPDVPRQVRVDAVRIRQVLANLVGNAIKFTPSGHVRLTLRMASDSLLWTVIDTGIGIDQIQQERIFQPYVQADASTGRHYGGTGLGLALCRELVTLMGGELRVESAVGQGSCFSASIPTEIVDPVAWAASESQFVGVPIVVVGAGDYWRSILSLLQAWRMEVSWWDEVTPIGMDEDRLWLVDEEWVRHVVTGAGSRVVVAAGPTFVPPAGTSHLIKPLTPAKLAERLQQAMQRPVVGTSGDATASRWSMPVLLVDDSDDTRILAERRLASLVELVWVARSGAETLALYRERGPSVAVVFLDVQMPGMDGFATLREIRRWERERQVWPPVPILALTAHAGEEAYRRSRAAGFTGHLVKPVSQLEMRVTLHWYGRFRQRPVPDDSIRDLVSDYVDRRGAECRMLVNACQAGDWDAVEAIAHRVRGSAAGYGFPLLSELAEEVETRVQRRDLTEGLLHVWQDYVQYMALMGGGTAHEVRLGD